MKKTLSALFALALSCSVMAAPVSLESVESVDENICVSISESNASLSSQSVFEGEGTMASPYLISTAEQLLAVAPLINSANGKDYYFKLTSDIDLENSEWTPIGTAENPFNGAFYGNGYSVSNLKITQEYTDTGFFGYVKKADITKFALHNVNFNYSNAIETYTGILAGRLHKEDTKTDVVNIISEISVTGKIDISFKSNVSSYTGGIIGSTITKSGNYSIENCLSLADISISSPNTHKVYVGGIVAKLRDEVPKYTLVIKNSFYSGAIDITSRGDVACGGIAGDVSSIGVGWTAGWYGSLMADSAETNITNNISGGSICINTTKEINVGYTTGCLNTETKVAKCARISTQEISAKINGFEYTKISDSPETVTPENFKTYATQTLKFDGNIWNFDYAEGIAVLGNTVIIKVVFDANGGENAPATQDKIYNSDIILSSAVPTRSGYVFLGWSLSADGEVEYAPGATYSLNENKTLYAVWGNGDISGDGNIDGTDIDILSNYVLTLISTPGETLPPEQFELANVYKDDEEPDGTGAKINIKDLIKLAQLASNN